MNAKIANRETDNSKKICTICKSHIKPVRIVKRGKSRMINTCGCGYITDKADITHLL